MAAQSRWVRWRLCVGILCAFGTAPVHAESEDIASRPLPSEFAAPSDGLDVFAIDVLARVIPPGSKFKCPDVVTQAYRGKALRYSPGTTVNPQFQERLAMFEEVVKKLSIEVYGRAPRRILHKGTYNCRPMRLYKDYLSEHAFANAIDFSGLEFESLTKKERVAAPAHLPKSLQKAFRITVLGNWKERSKMTPELSLHRRFLLLLTEELVKRPDIFRVILGPGYPGHDDHLHLDCSPFRMVEVAP